MSTDSFWDKYKKINVLGQGQYGKVYKAQVCETGVFVAVKKTMLDTDGIPATTLREIALLRNVSPHPNIVSYVIFFLSLSNGFSNFFFNSLLLNEPRGIGFLMFNDIQPKVKTMATLFSWSWSILERTCNSTFTTIPSESTVPR